MNVQDAKQAVQVAKNQVHALFEDEGVSNIGLEEVVNRGEDWDVTIGFSRPWDLPKNAVSIALSSPKRVFKVVRVNSGGEVISVQNKD